MTVARSFLHPSTSVEVLFPEEQTNMKPLNLADTYDSGYVDPYIDEEPTVKINMAAIHPVIKIEEEKRYPGVGLLMVLGFGLIFWGTVGWFIFR